MARPPIYKTCISCDKPFPEYLDKRVTGRCPPCYEEYLANERKKYAEEFTKRMKEEREEREKRAQERETFRQAYEQDWFNQFSGFRNNFNTKEPWRMRDTSTPGSSAVLITQEMLTKIIILCHPDKHNGSQLANSVTSELLKLRR